MTTRFQHFLFTSDESSSLDLRSHHRDEEANIPQVCLLVQLLTKSNCNKHAFMDTMTSLCGSPSPIQILIII